MEDTEPSFNPMTLALHLNPYVCLCVLCTVVSVIVFAPVLIFFADLSLHSKVYTLWLQVALSTLIGGLEFNTPVCLRWKLICKKKKVY